MTRPRLVSASIAGTLLAAGLVLIAPAPAGAVASLTVTTTGDTSSPRFLSLRRAIDRAEEGADATTINLQAGATYQLTRCNATSEDLNATGDLDVLGATGSVTIDGNGATIVQTCPGERVVDHLANTLTLREVTITGGEVDAEAGGDGGAVRSTGSLVLNQAVVVDNAATGDGGGLETLGASLTDSRLADNTAGGDGGGMHTTSSGIPPSVVSLTRSEVTGNTAAGNGGGLHLSALVTINRSAVIANTGAETGGAFLGTGTVTNSTFADSVETDGSPGPAGNDAVEVDGTVSLSLRHVTIRGGTGDGGALAVDTGLSATATAVDAGAAGSACKAGTDDTEGGDGANADSDDTCGFDDPTDLPAATLGLGAPVALNGGTTRSIKPNGVSALVDAVAPCSATVTVDQRGRPRPQGPACDIGSVERGRQPDALVRLPSMAAFRGNDVYDVGVGPSQIVGVTAPRGIATQATVRLQNDGEVRERQVVSGSATDNRFTVRYQSNGVDVTAAVVAGTFQTALLGPGASQDVVVRITPRRSAPVGAERQVIVRTRMVTHTPAADAVAVRVRAVA